MSRCRAAAALFILQLVSCAPLIAPTGHTETVQNSSRVSVREDLSGRFIALIGPRTQDSPPFLGAPDTNFSCIRSFFDRRTGEIAHQLYVVASYDTKRDWNAARDATGRPLEFIPVSRVKITCNRNDKCAYAEEFAAKISARELEDNRRGFSVTFTDGSGNAQTVFVSSDQVATQLNAVAEIQKRVATERSTSPPRSL